MEAESVIDQPERLERSMSRDVSVAALYRQEYAPMVRLAHLITGSNEVAEDVVQDAFVRMYRNWDRAGQPGAYLRTIVVNGCRTWHRRRRMERERLGVDPCGTRPGQALVLRFYVDMSEADVAQVLGCRPGTVKSLVHRGLRQLEEVIER
jgi:DNA-directed RNA polymerase specialized sigma24 family protein